MAISLNNRLIGLSVLGGGAAYSSYRVGVGSGDSPAVLAARKAFTTPATVAPWTGAVEDQATSAQVAAVKRLASIIDGKPDKSLTDLPDVAAAFTSYKALENLRILAEAGASKTISETERGALQKAFAKGLADLQEYIGSARTDLLEIGFGSISSSAKSVGVTSRYGNAPVAGSGVADTRAAPVSGLSGSEVLQITLSRGSASEVVTVDLAGATQPPTLDSVAAAINAAIGAKGAVDAGGAPVLDAKGEPVPAWKSRFSVEKNDGKWGLTFHPAGIEKVALDQVGAGDALMVAGGEATRVFDDKKSVSASIYRIEDLTGTLSWERLGRIDSVDSAATARAQAAAAKTTPKGTQSTPSDTKTADSTVYAPGTTSAITTDADGFSYVVGTTRGDLGAQLGDGTDDLFLTKLDSEGGIVWQRGLGGAGSASGAAVTIAPNGEIVVAGTVSGAFHGGDDAQTDLLVARFNTKGDELASTAIRQVGNESASAVAVGADGAIYVGGRVSTGGGDAVIVKLDASGRMVERRSIDSGGADSLSALAIDREGNLLVLGSEQGTATLRRIGSASLMQDLGSVTLGAASARAIAVSASGQIAVVGTTASALGGAQTGTIAGASDAFVTLIDADLTVRTTSYIGTPQADHADSVAFLNGALYVGGRTSGTLGQKKTGSVDGFIARIDAADGTVETVSQWGRASTAAQPVRIATVAGGATALGALGLHRGVLNQQANGDLIAETALRVGDSFRIATDNDAPRTITIEAGETMVTLAQKIRRVTGTDATIATRFTEGATSLRIDVKAGHSIELLSGPDGSDALAKLGLDPIRLMPPRLIDAKGPKVKPGGRFNLDLSDTLTLGDPASASAALAKIRNAISMTQSAYRSLYWDAGKAAIVDGIAAGPGTAYQQAKIASYQSALSRLTGGS